MKQDLDSMTSIIVVLTILLLSISAIFSGNLSLDKQLSASIINLIYDDHCADKAYDKFLDNWNDQCLKEGLTRKCSLDRNVANNLKDEYNNNKTSCR